MSVDHILKEYPFPLNDFDLMQEILQVNETIGVEIIAYFDLVSLWKRTVKSTNSFKFGNQNSLTRCRSKDHIPIVHPIKTLEHRMIRYFCRTKNINQLLNKCLSLSDMYESP